MEHHFIVRTNENRFLHLFYLKGSGLCCRTLPTGGKREYDILLRDAFYDFDVFFEPDTNTVHVVCQNSEGSIWHLMEQSGEWKKSELLRGKVKLPYPKHFRIMKIEGQMQFFYTLRHEGNTLLSRQYLGNDAPPQVVDYVNEQMPKFCPAFFGNQLHLFYMGQEGSILCKTELRGGFRPETLPFDAAGEQLVEAFLDRSGRVRLCTKSEQESGAAYYVRTYQKNHWSKRQAIGELSEPANRAHAVVTEEDTFFCLFSGARFYAFRETESGWERENATEIAVLKLPHPVFMTLCANFRTYAVGQIDLSGASLALQKSFFRQKNQVEELKAERKEQSKGKEDLVG